jgi:hypothetical protein
VVGWFSAAVLEFHYSQCLQALCFIIAIFLQYFALDSLIAKHESREVVPALKQPMCTPLSPSIPISADALYPQWIFAAARKSGVEPKIYRGGKMYSRRELRR